MEEIFELTDTSTGTANLDEVQGTMWLKDVIEFGEALRRFDQTCMQKDIPKGDKTVVFPKTTSHLTVNTSTAEGADRTFTEMNNLDTVSLTVVASDWKKGGIAITKEILETSQVDLIKQARYAIAQAIADDLDNGVATALQVPAVTNRVYGGSATSVATLGAGNVISTNLIADAMAKIEANNFMALGGKLFIDPIHQKVFRKDAQFVNAAEYGSDRVVLRGEIGEYLGLSIIVTNNVPEYSSGNTDVNETPATWAVDGKDAVMVGTGPNGLPVTGAIGWKEKPSITYEYERKFARHLIYYDQCFKAGVIQPGAVCLIKVANV
jgi:N4-gp56 family major capsid protein